MSTVVDDIAPEKPIPEEKWVKIMDGIEDSVADGEGFSMHTRGALFISTRYKTTEDTCNDGECETDIKC